VTALTTVVFLLSGSAVVMLTAELGVGAASTCCWAQAGGGSDAGAPT
jgi:hypothetical protein